MNAFTALKSVLIACGVLLVIVAGLFMYEMTLPAKPKRKRSGKDSDDEDEYISIAPTMTVRQIVKAYTLHAQEAEQKYTNRPMYHRNAERKIIAG